MRFFHNKNYTKTEMLSDLQSPIATNTISLNPQFTDSQNDPLLKSNSFCTVTCIINDYVVYSVK
ncbi:hypothetical protein HYC85_008504 [Camellia sinensis]|uniref:Uncharacterized protein n=1 Tax=Camellia sinensis TaxID=4442 RepID=A0A7J7HUI9_CAMSI|nr:hypothetical protein HYC85_008504 [Camellia sinensis]